MKYRLWQGGNLLEENITVSIGTTIPESTIRTEKPQSHVRGPLIWVNVLVAMSFIFGCGYYHKAPSRFQKIGDRANAFRMEVIDPFGLYREHVTEICVFELGEHALDQEPGQLFWEVVAVPPVRAKGFEVVVGQVPEGFRQVSPPPSETFNLVPGRWYTIAVTLTRPKARSWTPTPTSWKAE